MEPMLLPIWPDVGQALGGLGRSKIFELLAAGELKSVRIGRRRFVTVQSVTDYVQRLERAV